MGLGHYRLYELRDTSGLFHQPHKSIMFFMVRPVKNMMELEMYFYICTTLHSFV